MSEQKTVVEITQDSSPVQQLFLALDADLRKDPTGPNVRTLMQEYITKHDDYKQYMHFNDIKYARNLVNANDLLELIVLCWLPGQVSPVHNHAGQRCWAAVLEGTIQETHFCFENTHKTFGEGPLIVSDEHLCHQGEVGFITDDIALHVLQPMNGKRGVTLHLYSKPIAECNLYCPQSGTITKRKLGFYTINRKIQPQLPTQPCGTQTQTTLSGPEKVITNGHATVAPIVHG